MALDLARRLTHVRYVPEYLSKEKIAREKERDRESLEICGVIAEGAS